MARKLAGKYPYVKWSKVGQTVEGFVVKVEDVEIEGADRPVPMVHMLDKSGNPLQVTAGKVLRDGIADNDLTGKVARFTLTEMTTNGKGKALYLFDMWDLSDEYPTKDAYVKPAKAPTKGAEPPALDDGEDDDLPL